MINEANLFDHYYWQVLSILSNSPRQYLITQNSIIPKALICWIINKANFQITFQDSCCNVSAEITLFLKFFVNYNDMLAYIVKWFLVSSSNDFIFRVVLVLEGQLDKARESCLSCYSALNLSKKHILWLSKVLGRKWT